VKQWIGAAAAVVVIAGVFIVLRRPAKVVQAPVVPTAPAPTEVVLTGRVEPRVVVGINAPIEGPLDAFFVDAGAQVIEGQLIGRVRNPKAEASLQQTQADLDQTQVRVTELNGEQLSARLEASRAEADASRARGELDRLQKAYERQKGLWDAGATARLTFEKAQKDYNDAKSSIDKLEAAAKQAAAHLDEIGREIDAVNRAVTEKTAAIERAKQDATAGELHAPADGIIVARHGQPGDTVDPSVKLMEIAVELTKLQAIVPASEKIHAGQAAEVRIGDEVSAGAVQEVRGSDAVVYFDAAMPIDKLSLTAQVKIKF
jgi:multidrug resistance efflux pump